MSVEALDVILFASRNGLVISRAIAEEALASIDRSPLEATENNRYEAIAWDGKDGPPIGTADRWLHGNDGSSRSAIEALAQDKGVVYFLLRDGELAFWQPHRADKAGRIHMVDEPGHPNHWASAAQAHIDREVAQAVDGQVMRAALDAALRLHEARRIPYGGAAPSGLAIS